SSQLRPQPAPTLFPYTTLFRSDADGWRILEPVKARGDRGPIDETVTSVVTARMDREIEAAPKALGDFGLDKPVAEITAKLKDGKDRKSTRLNSSHVSISYAVFC